MATKKSSTSKTARVMNLLSKSREETAPLEEAAAPVSAAEESAPAAPVESAASDLPAAAPAHSAPTPPIITAMQADSAISNQVMTALEDALDSELGSEPAQAAPVQPEPTAEPAQEEAAPTAEPEVEPETKPEPAPIVSPIPEEETAAPAPEASAAVSVETVQAEDPEKEPAPPTQFKVDPNTTYVNVMETLVEEKAMKYIDMFGLCKCHRCVADVKAYALNHLAPKYVVMRTGEVIPRITVYEGQFAADVTAQILTACKVVMANPRHDL